MFTFVHNFYFYFPNLSLYWGCCLTCPGGKLCTLGPGGTRTACSSAWPRVHRDTSRGKRPQSEEDNSEWDNVLKLWLTSFTWSAAATSLKLQSKSFARISPARIELYLTCIKHVDLTFFWGDLPQVDHVPLITEQHQRNLLALVTFYFLKTSDLKFNNLK